jgi:hypothetical protein
MKKTIVTNGSYVGILFAIVVFLVGASLLILIPIGTIIGVLLMLMSLGMGGKRRKVWKCRKCGYIFERA